MPDITGSYCVVYRLGIPVMLRAKDTTKEGADIAINADAGMDIGAKIQQQQKSLVTFTILALFSNIIKKWNNYVKN